MTDCFYVENVCLTFLSDIFHCKDDSLNQILDLVHTFLIGPINYWSFMLAETNNQNQGCISRLSPAATVRFHLHHRGPLICCLATCWPATCYSNICVYNSITWNSCRYPVLLTIHTIIIGSHVSNSKFLFQQFKCFYFGSAVVENVQFALATTECSIFSGTVATDRQCKAVNV